MSEGDQFDERIRSALSRRADSVRVEPDLAGLAKHGGPRRTTTQRFPLLAVAIVLALLAVTTVAFEPVRDGDSRLIARSGNRLDAAGDPTSTTETTSSTSAPKRPKRSTNTTTTTTSTDVPTTLVPPVDPTSTAVPGKAPGDGTGSRTGTGTGPAPEPYPGDPSPPCTPVQGEILGSVPWQGDVMLLVQVGRNQTLRHLAVWRDVSGPDPCPVRVTDPNGQPFVFSRPNPGDVQFEVHAVACTLPRFEAIDGYSQDGVTWDFSLEAFVLDGIVATLVEDRSVQYVEPADHDAIQSLRQANCNGVG